MFIPHGKAFGVPPAASSEEFAGSGKVREEPISGGGVLDSRRTTGYPDTESTTGRDSQKNAKQGVNEREHCH